MRRGWEQWVALWDRREPATSMALVRIFVGAVVLFDLLWILRLDLVEALWAASPEGGLGFLGQGRPLPPAYRLFGASSTTAWLLFGASLGAALALSAGLFSRASALVLLFSQGQLAAALPGGDRGIDVALRAFLLLLALSHAGDTLSLDARRRGRPFVDDTAVPAWPRYLMLLQVVWIYFSAGVNKFQSLWYPPGGCIALHHVLHDPHYARFDPSWVVWARPLTQLGTFTTMVFEIGAPLLLIALHLENATGEPTRLRRMVAAIRPRWLFLGVGAFFHLGIAATLKIGIFPFGMLALYPALVPPELWRRLVRPADFGRTR